MPAVLIIAHSPLASTLKALGAHTYPEVPHLAALDVTPEMTPDEAEAQARALLAGLNQPEVLVLTDVFGATPCNAAMRLSDGERVRVVAGVNVPMLWRTLCYHDQPLDEALNLALVGATQGVMQVAASKPQNQASRPSGNDEEDNHHQQ